MGFFSTLAPAVSPRALNGTPSPFSNFWYTPEGWMLSLEDAGVNVTPELALTLSHVFCAVDTISGDFGTSSCQMFRDLGDGGRERVRYDDKQWGRLAYMLRWQPNAWQSAKQFWSTLVWQYLLRPAAYAEILRVPGTNQIYQIIPRHPDRVTVERFDDGTLRFKLREPSGRDRPVLQQDMLFVPNTSTDGLNAVSRVRYGAKAVATGRTLQDYTFKFMSKGATAALLASYKGEKDEPDEVALHKSISRFMNEAGGVMLIPEDVEVKSLGVDPNKAELLGLKDYSGRDIARMFKMPPHKLAIAGTQTYASQVQSAQEYVSGCQMPIVIDFEQASQMVILADTDVFIKFNMDYLLRADAKTRYETYKIGIESRIIRPSEARQYEDLNPDESLDKLSEGDYRPGSSSSQQPAPAQSERPKARATSVRALLMTHDAATRCVNRERLAIEKLAKKHASGKGWSDEVNAFYEDHARYISQTMRVSVFDARSYTTRTAADIIEHGFSVMSDDWARYATEWLTTMSFVD